MQDATYIHKRIIEREGEGRVGEDERGRGRRRGGGREGGRGKERENV